MNNQPKPINRSVAFWIGLTIHLALGAALYYNIQDKSEGTPKTEFQNSATLEATPTPGP